LYTSLNNDPELQLPIMTGTMTKDKKKEMSRLKAKVERIKRERRAAFQASVDDYKRRCVQQSAELEAEEVMMRRLLEVDWTLGVARIEQADVFNDRRHRGNYMFHSDEPRCLCGLPSCRLGTCTWTCCGDATCDSVGCGIVDDLSKPPYHPGTYAYHMEGCTCAQAKVVVERTRDVTRTLVSLDKRRRRSSQFSEMGQGDTVDENEQASENATSDDDNNPATFDASHSRQRLLRMTKHEQRGSHGSHSVRFCNPGGTVWSCCGAMDADSDGCMMWPRFLAAPNVMVWPRFESAADVAKSFMASAVLRKAVKQSAVLAGGNAAALDVALAKYCNVQVLGELGMRVEHCMARPAPSTPSRCTVIGTLHRPCDIAAAVHDGPLSQRAILCFEVQVLKCPQPQTHSEESLVIGFARQDAYVGPGVSIGSTLGLGWWANSTDIRGLGVSLTTAETYAENDVVCLALDFLNGQLYAFKNRRLMAHGPFRAPCALLPAVTLVAGTRIRVDETLTRSSVTYVDEYVTRRAETDLQQRLYGTAERYRSLFRDKFELQAMRSVGAESSDDEGRINFDV
jgi:hypothetical protein